MAEWLVDNILAILGLAGGLLAGAAGMWYSLRTEVNSLGGRVSSTEKAIIKHDKYHGEHFDAVREIESSVSALSQQFTDHDKRDDERFSRMDRKLDTIESDVKQILQRLPRV